MAEQTHLKVRLVFDTKLFEQTLNNATKTLEQFSSKVREISSKLSTLAIPLSIFSATTIKASADFEQAMNNVAAITNATKEEFKNLSEIAKNLGKTTQYSASEAATAIEMLAKNGLKVQQILDGALDSTIKLASATGTDLANAADVATDVMSQFRIDASKMSTVVDKIAGVTLTSKFSIDDYKYALAAAGGAAANLGVTLDDFNLAITATSSAFASGSDAGTSFKTFINNLVPKTKEAAEMQKLLGLEFYTADGQMKSMREIVAQLNNAFSRLTEEQKSLAAETLFGTDAMRTALTLANISTKQFDELSASINKVSATKMAETRMQGLNGAMRALKSAIEGLQIAVGESGLINFLTRIVQRTTNFISSLSSLNPALLRSITAITAITIALPALLAAVSAVSSVFAGFTTVLTAATLAKTQMITAIQKLVPALISLKKLSTALNTAFSLPAVKIIAIAGALYLASVAARALYDSFDSVRVIVDKIIAFFDELLAKIKNFAVQAINAISNFFSQLYDFVKDIPLLNNLAESIRQGIQFVADAAKSEEVKKFGQNFVKTLEKDFSTIKSFAQKMFLELGEVFNVGAQTAVQESIKTQQVTLKPLTLNIPAKFNIVAEKANLDAAKQVDAIAQIREKMQSDFEKIKVSSEAFFLDFDASAARVSALKDALQSLIDAGLQNTEMFKNLAADFKEVMITKEIENFAASMINLTSEMITAVSSGAESITSAIRKIIISFIAQGIAAVISKTMIAKGYTGPVAVALAGAAGAAAAALFSSMIPKFAEGGLVRGATVGLLGEYPNALNNPEVVMPLDRLESMFEPTESIVAQAVIKGEDLVTILKKTNTKLNYKFSI